MRVGSSWYSRPSGSRVAFRTALSGRELTDSRKIAGESVCIFICFPNALVLGAGLPTSPIYLTEDLPKLGEACGRPRVRGQETRAQRIDPRTANFFSWQLQTLLPDPTPICSTGVCQGNSGGRGSCRAFRGSGSAGYASVPASPSRNEFTSVEGGACDWADWAT